MRILYLCHRIPYPPNKGDKIRAFHQLRGLAAQHEVDLFTLTDHADDRFQKSALAPYCQRITVSHLSPRLSRLRALPFLLTQSPLTLPYFYCAELHREIRSAILQRSYDRIFVLCSAMAQYVDLDGGIPVVLDLVDVDSDKWSQYADSANFPLSVIYKREARQLQKYERNICEKAACVLVTTAREAQLVRQIAPAARVHVVPIGIDTKHYNQVGEPPVGGARTIIFVGEMSYYPNEQAVIYFARYVLSLINQSLEGVRFLIVGRNPGRKVKELQEIHGIEVTGSVPDVRPYLAQAQVSVAPFKIAAGLQTKILEALASGLPVVATPRALQGLSPRVADVIEAGESAAEMAAKIVFLLKDPELARRLGLEGRCRVAAEYDWGQILGAFLQLIENPAVAEEQTVSE
jgi:sugar transferase (PEP-CTERM/EpsH1 system associated)